MSDQQDSSSGPSAGSESESNAAPALNANNHENRVRYWRANQRLIVVLLAIWAFVSLGCSILFIEPLNRFKIGHLPLGFWFAQQGSIYVFVVLIFVYAFQMDRLDRRYGVKE
jgi:putative solute:sodium symporter small subunit